MSVWLSWNYISQNLLSHRLTGWFWPQEIFSWDVGVGSEAIAITFRRSRQRHCCSSQLGLLAQLVGVGQQPACSAPAPTRPFSVFWVLSPGSEAHATPWWRPPASFLGHMGYGVWRWWEVDTNLPPWIPVCPCSSLLRTQLFILTVSPPDLQWLQTHHQMQKRQLSIELFTMTA